MRRNKKCRRGVAKGRIAECESKWFKEKLEINGIMRQASEEIDALRDKVVRLEWAVKAENARYVKAQNRLQLFEAETQAKVRYEADMKILEISGEKPFLVISAPKKMLEPGAWAQLNWKLKRAFPNIRMIFFIEEGVCSLTELNDKDLYEMGLARIIGTNGSLLAEGMRELPEGQDE